MSTIARPEIDCDQYNTTLYVSDLAASQEFYTDKLGFRPAFTWGDPPTLAGVLFGDVQIFLQRGTPQPDGCWLAFMVGDADELYGYHRANGVEIVHAPKDEEYRIRDYTVRDLNGYYLTFGHALSIAEGLPVPVERVDVPLRLEKRLAALLQELAAHKRMSLSSCIEEMALHSFEPLGEGVASPHTRSDLRYIQRLKAKHGIDYDCHASYRFVEE